MNVQGFIPIQLVVFFLPLSFMALSLFLSFMNSSSWSYHKKVFTLVGTSAWCIGLCIFSICYLIRPTKEAGALKGDADGLSMFFGTAACFVYGPFAVVCLFLAWSQRKPQKAPVASAEDRQSYGTDLEPLLEAAANRITEKRFQTNMSGYYLFCLFVVIPCIIFFVMLLPPIWNVLWQVYQDFDSSYSLVHIAPEGDNHTNLKLYEDVVCM